MLIEAGAARVFGLSTQDPAYQREAAERLHLPFPLLSDEKLALTRALRLPTMQVAGLTLIKRLALVIDDGSITKVFYPVFPPDRNAGRCARLAARASPPMSARLRGARRRRWRPASEARPAHARPRAADDDRRPRQLRDACGPRDRLLLSLDRPAGPAQSARLGRHSRRARLDARRPRASAISTTGFAQVDASVFGLSTQPTAYQQELVERLGLPFALVSDAEFALARALALPTFETGGVTYLKRLTLGSRTAASIGSTIPWRCRPRTRARCAPGSA